MDRCARAPGAVCAVSLRRRVQREARGVERELKSERHLLSPHPVAPVSHCDDLGYSWSEMGTTRGLRGVT